jgi:hypothetical protein
MHGIIFTELRKYVDTKLGGDAWGDLLNAAGLKGRMYLPIQEYPDAEAVTLVTTAAQITGLDAAVILQDFGVFIAPSLLGMYRTLVKPEWRTLEVLEFTEGTIHKVVRARNPGAKPAELTAVRISETELHLTYGSHRKMCPVAKGIIKGLGLHFGEEITVVETQCMHQGASECKMVVEVVGAVVKPKAEEKAPARATAAKKVAITIAKPEAPSRTKKAATNPSKPSRTAAKDATAKPASNKAGRKPITV